MPVKSKTADGASRRRKPVKDVPVMGLIDSIVAQSGDAKPKSTSVTVKLSAKAHAAVRDLSDRSGLSMSNAAKAIIDAALTESGVDVADSLDGEVG